MYKRLVLIGALAIAGCSYVKGSGELPDGTKLNFTAVRWSSDGNFEMTPGQAGAPPTIRYGNLNHLSEAEAAAMLRLLGAAVGAGKVAAGVP